MVRLHLVLAAAIALACLAVLLVPAPPASLERLHRFTQGPIKGLTVTPDRDELAGRAGSSGPLLLFLPATGAQPEEYTALLDTAIDAGYHVLGLNYWNLGGTLSATCRRSPHCYTVVQRNRFDGRTPSALSRVDHAGSITARVGSALRYLRDRDPDGGWDRYVAADGIRWRRIVVAGHSQGGSEAAYIAHVRSVRGLLMFGAPALGDRVAHADWMDHTGRTPMTRAYALVHAVDHYRHRIATSLRLLGVPGADRPVRIGTRPPTRAGPSVHVVVTSVERRTLVARGAQEGSAAGAGPIPSAHRLVAGDRTPRDAVGTPRLQPVWRWMLARVV